MSYALGGCPRDDDIAEQYGSVCYLYNDEEVIVSAPMAINDHDSGLAIYAGLAYSYHYSFKLDGLLL